MKKRVLGVLLAVVGIILLIASGEIAGRVASGREEIRSGQQKVDTANQLFSLSPSTKPVGKAVTGSAQKKIDAGTQEADKYQTLADQLHTGGYILIIVGAFVFVYSFFRKKK